MSVAEKRSRCQGAVDIEPLARHCSTATMVKGGAERAACMPATVLGGGSDISIVGEAGLRRLQQHFQGLRISHPCGPSLSMSDGRGVSTTQQTGPLTATTLTPWALVVIRLSVSILPGGDDVLILGSRTFGEERGIDLVQGLTPKVIDRGALESSVAGDLTPGKCDAAGTVGLRRLSVSLAGSQRITDSKEEPDAHRNSFTEDFLARGPSMVMEPNTQQSLRLEALESALDQRAQEGMPPETLY